MSGLSVGHSDDPAIAAHLQLDNPDRKSRGAPALKKKDKVMKDKQ